MWNIDVPYDGWYHLAFHYSQPNKEGQSVYRDIEIDGKVPFRQLKEVAFPYTGNGYENKVVEIDGEAVKIYLTAGKHTLGLYTQAPSTQAALEEISRIISEISDISLRLQQVAGSKADKNRTWDIETYVPGVVGQLRSLEDSLLTLYEEMGRQAGTTPASCLNLKMAAGIIGRALKKPEKLPSNVSKLSIGTNSVTELIATLQNEIREQGIALDSFYLYGEKNTLPKASAGFFTSTVMGVKRFFYLFNSIVVTLAVVVFGILISASAAYSLSKVRFKGRSIIFKFNTLSMMFVATAVSIPRYLIIKQVGLLDTFTANIIPMLATPVVVFLLKQFVDQIPNALIEAAKIDGASDYRILFRIILPLIKPALATAAIILFQSAWNSMEASNLFINRDSLKTFAFYMNSLSSADNGVAGTGMAAAAAMIVFIPNIVLFIVMQSRVMDTMAHSGLK